MSEANREFLSAGMDGELSREEIRFLLRRLDADQGLNEPWSRYHVARDGLRRESAPPVSRDFASRVMAAIEAESAIAVPAAPSVAAGCTGRPVVPSLPVSPWPRSCCRSRPATAVPVPFPR